MSLLNDARQVVVVVVVSPLISSVFANANNSPDDGVWFLHLGDGVHAGKYLQRAIDARWEDETRRIAENNVISQIIPTMGT